MHGLGEPSLGSLQPSRHRGPRNPARGGDLVEVHSVDEPKREGDPLVRRHAVKHAIEGSDRFVLRRARRSRVVAIELLRVDESQETASAPLPDEAARLMNRDAREPGAQGTGIFELVDRAESRDEDILEQIGDVLNRSPERGSRSGARAERAARRATPEPPDAAPAERQRAPRHRRAPVAG